MEGGGPQWPAQALSLTEGRTTHNRAEGQTNFFLRREKLAPVARGAVDQRTHVQANKGKAC